MKKCENLVWGSSEERQLLLLLHQLRGAGLWALTFSDSVVKLLLQAALKPQVQL